MKEINPSEPSKGLGDSIAKITHALGIDKAVNAVANAVGVKDCGCNARQKLLNQLFPYENGVQLETPDIPEPDLPSPTPRIFTIEDYEFEGHKKFLIHKEFSINDSNRNMKFNYVPGDIVDITNTDPVYPNIHRLLQSNYLSLF